MRGKERKVCLLRTDTHQPNVPTVGITPAQEMERGRGRRERGREGDGEGDEVLLVFFFRFQLTP